MYGLNKIGEAQMLRAEGDRMLSNALVDRIAAATRSAREILRRTWDLTIREASFQLESGRARRAEGRRG